MIKNQFNALNSVSTKWDEGSTPYVTTLLGNGS
jgi:hypothetical protein